MKKGATRRPLFVLRERSAYRFLPAFFFPPLAFFAIVCYPPLHLGLLARTLADSYLWLPPGTLTRDRRSTLCGTFRIFLTPGTAELGRARSFLGPTSLGVA